MLSAKDRKAAHDSAATMTGQEAADKLRKIADAALAEDRRIWAGDAEMLDQAQMDHFALTHIADCLEEGNVESACSSVVGLDTVVREMIPADVYVLMGFSLLGDEG